MPLFDELEVGERLRGFSSVRVSKDNLVERITKNREDHRRIFEEALDGWKKKVTADLEEAVADAKAGKDWRIRFNNPRPEDHTDDYDTVLTLLKLSEDDMFELNYREFESYVMDKWGWQASFLSNTYGSTTAELKRGSLNLPDNG